MHDVLATLDRSMEVFARSYPTAAGNGAARLPMW
jgi:hypothetical protein